MALALKTRWERLRSVLAPVPSDAERLPTVYLKVNPVSEILARLNGGGGRPMYTPGNMRALAKDGFSTNAYGYRAVMLIAQACAGIPWILYQNGRSKRTALTSHPLLDLWRRPNPQQALPSFIEYVVAFWYITGNSYVTVGSPETGPNKNIPQQLWTLRPDKVQIVPDPVNFIGGFVYTDGGQKQPFDANKVMHLKFFNPENDYYGLSPLATAGRAIDQMNAGNEWNLSLMLNSAVPSGALVMKQGLTPTQRAKIEQLMREKHQGPQNAGIPLVLDDTEADWRPFGLKPADVQWLEGKGASILEIGMAVGVPPEMLGNNQARTYANYSEARSSFYEETVLPKMDHLEGHINSWLVPMFGDNLYLGYDKDSIEALAEDRDKVWIRAETAWEKGLLSKNEARALIGYDPLPDGDVWILPTAMQIATNDTNPALPGLPPGSLPPLPEATIVDDSGGADTSTSGDSSDGEFEAASAHMRLLLKRWQEQGASIRIAPRAQRKSINLKTAEEKAAHWEQTEQSRANWYEEVASQIEKQFASEQKMLLAALNDGQTPDDAMQRALKAIDSFEADWTKLLAAVYAAVGNTFGQQTYDAIQDAVPAKQKAAFPIDIWKQAILNWLGLYAGQKITNILDTTRQQVRDELKAGVDAGESILQLAKRIQSLFSGPNAKNRSRLIAVTEVISASNLGSQAAARSTGLRLEKEWIATPDSHTRETHAAADGQRQPLDTPYTVGGASLMFPGDSSLGAPASELCNCRCTEGYHTDDEEGDV